MRVIQNAIEEVLRNVPSQALSVLIEKKVAAQGIKLSNRERDLLIKNLLRNSTNMRLRRWKWWERRSVKLEFTQDDFEEIERMVTKALDNGLPDIIRTATEELAHDVLLDLIRKWPAESRQHRRHMAGFRKRLYSRWKVPLETLRLLSTVSREFGESINQEIRQEQHASDRRNLIDVLIRSHARACQITEEIVCLLEGGFADGAMARWRTLHEVAVVALFIAAHGEDLAERYVLHQAVESKRANDDYQKCQKRLGYEPLSVAEIETVNEAYDSVVARFGEDFGKGDYGWAGHHLGIAKPTFRDIERAARIDHLRAHYRMASHNVHANPKGVFFKLGLLNEAQVLLAGASNAGLADPGGGAALSLAQVCAALACLQQPTVDNNAALLVIAQLAKEIGEAFGQAHEKLEADDASALRVR